MQRGRVDDELDALALAGPRLRPEPGHQSRAALLGELVEVGERLLSRVRGELLRVLGEDLDAFWSKLAEGGEEGPCGWLKDRFGVSWQIVPTVLPELLADPDREKSQRVMAAMLNMKKIEIDALERAAA